MGVHVSAPRDVLLAIHRDTQQYLLGRVLTHGGFNPTTTWWEPIRVLIHTSEASLWGLKTPKRKKSKQPNDTTPQMEQVKEDDPDLTLHPKGKGVSKTLDHKLAGSLAKIIAK